MPNAPTAALVLRSAAKLVGQRLGPRGFKRQRLKFVRHSHDVVSLIEFQASTTSTRAHATYVVNYGVFCLSLGDPGSSLFHSECHWGNRVRDAANHERWFPVRATDDPNLVATSAGGVIESDVLPELESMQTDDALIAIWKTGVSPNLGEAQRLKYLALLSHKNDDLAEVERCRRALERLADGPFIRRALAEIDALT